MHWNWKWTYEKNSVHLESDKKDGTARCRVFIITPSKDFVYNEVQL